MYNNFIYIQLPRFGHPAIKENPLLRTGAKFQAETTKKCINYIKSRYYGIVGSLYGPKSNILLFYSRYNGHLTTTKLNFGLSPISLIF